MPTGITESPTVDLGMGRNVKQFTIPEDQQKRIIDEMVIAFYGNRKGCETERSTEEYCREILRSCMTQFKGNKIWKNAPGKNADNWVDGISARLRVYGYDFKKKELIKKQKSVKAILQEKFQTKPETEKVSDPFNFQRKFNPEEEEMYRVFVSSLMEEMSISFTRADQMMINRLAFLHVLNSRDIRDVELSKSLTDEIIKLTESLGISGKQRMLKFDKDKQGTLEELTTIYKATLDEHLEIERGWQIEELQLVSQALHRGDMEEFIGMYWIKTLYGDKMHNGPISLVALDEFLKKANSGSKAE